MFHNYEEQVKHKGRRQQSNSGSSSPKSPMYRPGSYVQEEFLEYFSNQNVYELTQRNVQDHFYGQVDLYRLKHHIASQLKVQGGYPRWLPIRLAVKSISLEPEHQHSLENQVADNSNNLFFFHPEFVKVVAAKQDNQGVRVFYEYQDYTLEQDISHRRRENRYFEERILWNILYNLIRASHLLNVNGQSMYTISPSSIFFANYQPQVIPQGLVPEREVVQGDDELYNQMWKVGETILRAGLLIEEHDFDVDRLRNYLSDFARRYAAGSDKHLLYVLERLLLNERQQDRITPKDLFDFLSKVENEIVFLENSHLRQFLSANFARSFPQYSNFGYQHTTESHSSHHHNVGGSIERIAQHIVQQTNPTLVGSSVNRSYKGGF